MNQERWTAVLAHRDRLLRLALSRGVSREDANDVVQEAMLRCAESEALDLDRLGQFLTTVTIRLCADVHRRKDEPARAQRWLGPLLHDAPDPADVVCRDYGVAWVSSLAERLPEKQRGVLFDRARGLSIQQIATRHKLTYKAAESALSRARAAMRSAVTASFSVAAFLSRRSKGHDVAVTVSAAAFVVTAAVLSPGTPHDVSSPEASRPRAIVADAQPSVVPGVSPSARPTPRPTRTPDPTAPPASPPGSPRPSPTYPPDPIPTFTVSHGPLKVERHEDGYTTEERLLQCIQYGVSTTPPIRCNYPSPTPGERS